MLKRLALALALVASSAYAQQELSLTAKDIESGSADAKLAELGRQAAVTGREVIVNAPKEWHGRIAAKVKAGGKAEIKLNDSFFENVVVRVAEKSAPKVETKPVEPAKPAAPPKPAAAPTPAPKAVEPPPAPAPAPKPVEVPPPPAPVERAPAPTPPPAPVETPKPVAATPAPAADPTAAARRRMEQSLNESRPATGELDTLQLRKTDLIYIDGDVRGVRRRDRLKTQLYWLTGDLNLKRAELKPLAENRYEVVDDIKSNSNLSLRNDATGAALVFNGKLPADADAERAEMEKAYGEGRPIARGLRADQLRQGDIVYLGKSAAVIVRRDGTALVRYWLEGPLNLNQRGVQKEKESTSKYRILSDNIE